MDLAIVLTPTLLADVLNPVLFAYLVFLSGGQNSYRNMILCLTGHTVAYFTAGLILAVGLEQIQGFFERQAEPSDYLIEFFVGIALVVGAYFLVTGKGTNAKVDTSNKQNSSTEVFFMGAAICIIGVPFALPYFAAIAQILKADLSTASALVVLLAYNALYAIPFLLVPLLCYVLGERARFYLAKVNDFLTSASAWLMPILLALGGGAMALNALLWWQTGAGLF